MLACSVATALAAAVAALVLPAVAAAGWSIEPSPNPPGSAAFLSAVSCAPGGTCLAVGASSPASTEELPLAELWNGFSWTVVPVPAPAGMQGEFAGVSCPEAGWCLAVGRAEATSRENPLVELWNGRRWSRVPAPSPGTGASLSAVSCSARARCTAVGGFTRRTPEAQQQPLTVRRRSSRWLVEASPSPEAENGSSLDAVSCPASQACVAGGVYEYFDVDAAIFAERWSGTAWALESQPKPEDEEEFALESSISCTSPSACMAVGSWLSIEAGVLPLAESFGGNAWIQVPTAQPDGSQIASLSGVSCTATSGTACVAVGEWSTSSIDEPAQVLTERWDGTAWTLQEAPDPAGARRSSLAGIDCGGEVCTAVGSSWDGTATHTLTERYTP